MLTRNEKIIIAVMSIVPSIILVTVFGEFMQPPIWAKIFEYIAIWGMFAGLQIRHIPELRESTFGVAIGLGIITFGACGAIVTGNMIAIAI